MISDADTRKLLARAAGPRSPSPAVDQALRRELFGGRADGQAEQPASDRPVSDQPASDQPASDTDSIDAAVDLEHRLRPVRSRTAHVGSRRRRQIAAAVAGVAVAAAIVAVVVVLPRDESGHQIVADDTDHTTETSISRAAATQACERFGSTAFGDRTRTEVIGPELRTVLPDPASVGAAALAVKDAYESLVAELQDAGVDVGEFAATSDRIATNLDMTLEPVASGDYDTAATRLGSTEEMLMSVDRTLTEQGLNGCL